MSKANYILLTLLNPFKTMYMFQHMPLHQSQKYPVQDGSYDLKGRIEGAKSYLTGSKNFTTCAGR